ncbi:hypothetical protein, partial [Myxococcus eversor]|uniref:hypothetical protein n=1 Tax=Myxococcus eversor TaxID=2709661 RepID=UPI001967BD4A
GRRVRLRGKIVTKAIRTILSATTALMLAWPLQAQAQAKPKKEPSAAQLAARERQKQCSAEWKDAKAGGKLTAGTKWPQFWSACNTRLKAKPV